MLEKNYYTKMFTVRKKYIIISYSSSFSSLDSSSKIVKSSAINFLFLSLSLYI